MTTQELLHRARQAKGAMALAGTEAKNRALRAMADALADSIQSVLTANGLDLIEAKGTVSTVMLDRLALSEERILSMAQGVRDVAGLPTRWGRCSPAASAPTGW